MPLAAAVAVIIVLVIAMVASREQIREPGEPEQRSPSSIDAPYGRFRGAWQPGFVAAGTPFRQLHRSDSINAAPATLTGGPGNYLFLSILQPVKNGHRLGLSPIGSAVSSPSAS